MSIRGEHLEVILDEEEPDPSNANEEEVADLESVRGLTGLSENSARSDEGPEIPEGAETETSEPKDEDYDTDLEIEDEKTDFHQSGRSIYEMCCRNLDVVPISYFIRHINDPVLRMPHHGVGVLGAKAIAIPLVSSTLVVELNLEDNSLEDQGTIHICEMLLENCYIANLNLAWNNLGQRGAKAVCDMLIHNFTLVKLDISGNNIGDNAASYIAAALLDNSRLGDLNLSHNKLGDRAGQILGPAIAENIGLEVLNLSWNYFRGKGGVDLVDGIKNSSRLKCVNLSWNGLGAAGARAVADCVRNNHLIRGIDITCNRIDKAGAEAIAKAFETNETLQAFSVGRNPIEAIGAMNILKAANNEVSGLKELDLSNIQVEKEFVALMNEMVESHDLKVQHGGVLSNYVLKGPPKKHRSGDLPEKLTRDELEEIIQKDPINLLNMYLETGSEKLHELYRAASDNSKNFPVEFEDIKVALAASCGSALTEEQVEEIMQNINKGGAMVRINYSDVMEEVFAIKRKP